MGERFSFLKKPKNVVEEDFPILAKMLYNDLPNSLKKCILVNCFKGRVQSLVIYYKKTDTYFVLVF